MLHPSQPTNLTDIENQADQLATQIINQTNATEHPVSCATEGQIALDTPLYCLLKLAQTYPLTQALTAWTKATAQNTETAYLALQILAHADVLIHPDVPKPTAFQPTIANTWPALTKQPLVSVIIVNRNGQHHLATCLPSLAAQHYPNIEIIVVDNGSDDNSIAWLNQTWPQVKIIALAQDIGFAGANNAGIAQANGDYFFLLNNDTKVDPYAIQHLINRLQGEDQVGAVVPLIRLMAQPAFINALGNTISPQGWGSDSYIGHLDVGQLNTVRHVSSACFAAVLIPRIAYQTVGPMDEAYTYYYEDADWSWRARLLGLNILAEPQAIIYHAFGGTSTTKPWPRKLKLVVRNRLRFILKILSRPKAWRIIKNYLHEDIAAWRLARKSGDKDIAEAYTIAWKEALAMLPDIRRQRRYIQATRLVTDEKIFREMQQIPAPRQKAAGPFLSLSHILQDYSPTILETGAINVTQLNQKPTRNHLLIISPDVVKKQMAGPGIRYWELARALSKHLTITLAIPNQPDMETEQIHLTTYNPHNQETIRPLQEKADVILGAIDMLYRMPFLAAVGKPLILDLYAPFLLENLEMHRAQPMPQRDKTHRADFKILKTQTQYGDFFICASERQRDLWLGVLLSHNRINPITYSRDESLRRLIDVVPFGISSIPPQSTGKAVLKGVVSGIGPNDKVILWGGGIWNWLDPLTPIKAMLKVIEIEPKARLFFLGGRHPNPIVPDMQMAVQAEALAEELGLLNKYVFFNHTWVAYEERVNYLLESDLAVSAHKDHVETRFAFRTRLLDCIWSELPMVVTEGDVLADLVQTHDLGRVVPADDIDSMAEGLLAMLKLPAGKQSLAANFKPVQTQFTWDQVSKPLLNFCLNPCMAIDRAADPMLQKPKEMYTPPPTPIVALPAKAVKLLFEHGPFGLLAEISRYLLWRLSR